MRLRKEKLKEFCRCVSLRDKCLIIFMIVLMIQLGSSLFFQSKNIYGTHVNVVIRTTISAVFGYFVSSNFVSRREKESKESKGKIKCVCELEKEDEEIIEEPEKDSQKTEDRVQIMIVSTIGLVCLILMCVAIRVTNLPEDAYVAIAQCRSLVSGCVGFLIGIPSDKDARR